MERFQSSRHKMFTCVFPFPTSAPPPRVQPRAHSFDENHLISGRTPPHFRPQGIASAQDRQHSGQGAIGGRGIGEAAFQGRVEKRTRIGLRRDLRRGSWHRFETRFAVQLHGSKKCGRRARQRRPTQPAPHERTARACSAQRRNAVGPLNHPHPFPETKKGRPRAAFRTLRSLFATDAAHGP